MASEWDVASVSDDPEGWEVVETADDVPATDGDMNTWQSAGTVPDEPFLKATYDKLSRFLGSMGRGFNEEVANVLGLPGDMMNSLFSLAGIENRQFHGSKELQEILDASPITETRQGNENRFAANTGQILGYVPALMTPAIRVGRRLVGASPILTDESAGIARRTMDAMRGVGRDIAVRTAEAPGRALAGEVAASLGAGAGVTAAQSIMPGSPVAEMVGGVAGGFAPGAAAGAGIGAARQVGSLLNVGGQTERRVAEFLQKAAGDSLPRARERLRDRTDEFDANLTPGQITASTGLLRLERSIIKGNDTLGNQFIERRQSTDAALTGAIAETEPGTATREVVDQFFDGRIDRITSMVDDRIRQAANEARRAADEIPPEIRGDHAARLAREELDRALDDARADESSLWANINQDSPIRTSRSKNAVAGIRREFDAAVENPADLPGDVITVIDDLAEAETIGRMLKLRSRVLADIRQARSGDAPNRKLVANLERLQESILDDIGATNAAQERLLRQGRQTATAPNSIEARNQMAETRKVRAALQFSRDLNDKFTRGPVGKLLGYERSGGARTPDELTLSKILQPGFMGLRHAKAIIDATGGSERMLSLMENYLRDAYTTAVARPGADGVDAAAHARFMKRHGEVLGDFPTLKRQLEDVNQAHAILAARNAQGERARGLIEKSRAQLWLDADDVSLSLARVLNTPTRVQRGGKGTRQINQRAAAENLMRSVNRDPSGLAASGVRRELLNVMLQKVRRGVVNPQTGEKEMSAAALRNFMAAHRPALQTILRPDQQARLQRILSEAEKANRTLTTTIGGGSDTFENLSGMQTVLAKVFGARIGAAVGHGASKLQTASFGARLATRWMEGLNKDQAMALIEQALLDPKVMKDLLERPTAIPQRDRQLIRRLRAHVVAAGMPAPPEPAED